MISAKNQFEIKIIAILNNYHLKTVYKNISSNLSQVIENLIINNNVSIFYTGGMDEFDEIYASIVRKLKNKYEHISLILVKPYLSNEMNKNKYYYETMYDAVIIPEICANLHPKSAIKKRNEWMIDNSEYVVSYVYRDFGGAYNSKMYAVKKNKVALEVYPHS